MRIVLALALAAALVGCSKTETNDADTRVCQMVLADTLGKNRVAWGELADPATPIGQAAIAASQAHTAQQAYDRDKALTAACVDAGY